MRPRNEQVSTSRRWALGSAMLGILAVISWFALKGFSEAPTGAPPAPSAAIEVGEPPAVPGIENQVGDPRPLELPAARADAATRATSAPSWRGRILGPDGTPVAGMPWSGACIDASMVEHPFDGRTDAVGRFLISMPERPLAAGVTFEPASGGLLRLSASGPVFRADVDLGDFVLPETAVITGSIVDAERNAMPGPWDVHSSRDRPSRTEPQFRLETQATIDVATGRFEIRGVEPGTREVRASLPIRAPDGSVEDRLDTEPQTLLVAPGRSSELDLVYRGPDPRRQLRVLATGVEGRPCGAVAGEHAVLTGPDGPLRAPVGRPGSTLLFWDDVPPGRYGLEIRDPAHLPWRRDDIQPGLDLVLAELDGTCVLEIRAVDAVSGAPVTQFRAWASVQRTSANGSSWTRTTRSPLTLQGSDGQPAEHPGGTLLLDRMPADALQLVLEAPGYERFEGLWEGVAFGGHGSFVASLLPLSGVSGRVLRADGSPAADVAVALFGGGHDPEHPWFIAHGEDWNLDNPVQGHDREGESTRTADDGSFRLQGAGQGIRHVRAWESSVADAFVTLDFDAHRDFQDVELVLPDTTEFAGRLVQGDSAPAGRWSLAMRPAEEATERRMLPIVATSEDDGSFRFGHVPPGAWLLFALGARREDDVWQPLDLPVPITPAPASSTYGAGYGSRNPCGFLGRVEVPGDRSAPVFDVASLLAGSLRMQILGRDEPVVGAQVYLWTPGADRQTGPVYSGNSDAEGWVAIDHIVHGEYVADVRLPKTGAPHADERQVSVRAGAEVSLVHVTEMRSGTLLCLDAASGLPLASSAVRVWRRDGDRWWPEYLRTDATGRAAFASLPTELRVGRAPDEAATLMTRIGEVERRDEWNAFERLNELRTADRDSERWRTDVVFTWGGERREVEVRIPSP